MMNNDFNKWGSTDIRLIEELAELTKAIIKAKRFGIDSSNPLILDSTPNRKQILLEIADCRILMDELEEILTSPA